MKSVATSVPISAPPPMPSIHTLGNSRKKTAVSYSSSLTLLCSVLFIVAIFNTMFAVLMAYKNSLVLEENLELIRENRMLISTFLIVLDNFSGNIMFKYLGIQNYLREYVKPSRGSFLRNVPQMEMKEIERFAKVRAHILYFYYKYQYINILHISKDDKLSN